MMALGPCRFSIDTFAHDNLVRTRSWKWAADDVVGAYPTLQYTGPQAETIVLNGWTYPGFKVAGYLIEAMALLAGNGKPLLMVSGYGMIFGFWVIESIVQTESTHNVLGMPRKVQFAINHLKTVQRLFGAIQMLINAPLSTVGFGSKDIASK